MPATETQTQVNPSISHLYALFTNVSVGFSDFDLVEVSAFIWHGFLQTIELVRQVTSVT